MKIKSVTITYELKTTEDQTKILSLLALHGSSNDTPKDRGAEKEGPVAYTPSSERTKLALDALNSCKRVRLQRPEILEAWAKAFPHINLASEINKADAWAESKDVVRKPKGWAKTLNSWLTKAQDNTRGAGAAPVVARAAVSVTPEAEVKDWIEAAA